MFDKKVHHYDQKGQVVKVTPYTLVQIHGRPDLFVRPGKINKAYYEDGSEYVFDTIPEDIRKQFRLMPPETITKKIGKRGPRKAYGKRTAPQIKAKEGEDDSFRKAGSAQTGEVHGENQDIVREPSLGEESGLSGGDSQ